MGYTNPKTGFLVQYRDNVTSREGAFHLKTNDLYEIYTYVYGEGPYLCFFNDEIYTVEPDSVLILRPGVLVGSCKKKKKRYARLVCKLPVYMADFISRLDPSLFSFLFDGDVGIIKLEGEIRRDYFALVDELIGISESEGEHNEALMFSVILKMLAQLSFACSFAKSGENPIVTDELISRIIEKINREYAEISSVADLAEKMHYSKNYISQYFKSRMNMGLHDFLLMKKLSVAATQLIAGKSVTDVAFECGFGSTAYFISVFKTRYGVTPGKYISDNR